MRYNKQSDYIKAIEENSSLVQLIGSDGSTVFHLAAMYGRLQVMEAINTIDTQMKVRADKYHRTPLMYASRSDHAACVKWLLDHDADINIKDIDGKTALNYASNQKIKDMIKEK